MKKSVIVFTASWCGPCQSYKPVVRELAEELPTIAFDIVDIEAHQEVAKQYGVRSLPTTIVKIGDEVVGEFRGAKTKSELLAAIGD